MDANQIKKRSKYLSLVLRHRPHRIGISLDSQGWTDVHELLTALQRQQFPMTHAELQEVVETNDKQRFSFSEDGTRIRANQGHSVDVDLGYEVAIPPDFLYHGTPQEYVDSIRQSGLKKMQRHHVHLHTDLAIAMTVGQRRGRPVVLTIHARQMHEDGYQFFVSPNGVWLTDSVPAQHIEFPL